MSQIIITVIYDTEACDVGINAITLGPDKTVSVKDLLMALHMAEGQYLEALQVEEKQADATDD